jgi:hypothetical protein
MWKKSSNRNGKQEKSKEEEHGVVTHLDGVVSVVVCEAL